MNVYAVGQGSENWKPWNKKIKKIDTREGAKAIFIFPASTPHVQTQGTHTLHKYAEQNDIPVVYTEEALELAYLYRKAKRKPKAKKKGEGHEQKQNMP